MQRDKPIHSQDCLEFIRKEVFTSKSLWKKELHHRATSEEIGLEIEMLPVRAQQGVEIPQLVPLYDGDESLLSILNTIYNDKNSVRKYAPVAHAEKGAREVLYEINVEKEGRVTFEPGGQIEFSTRPFSQLSELVSHLERVQQEIDTGFKKQEVVLVQSGMNPWYSAKEIGLQMIQGRYQAMTEYFASLNGVGLQMMRQSCSIQVNLDFGSNEETLVRRYLAAHLIAPLTTAIFSNSPIVEKKLTPYHSYRGWIWQNIDPTRSGLNLSLVQKLKEKPKQETCIQEYLAFALNAPVVFIESLDFLVPPKKITFGEWLETPFEHEGKKVSPTFQDFNTHLSLLFPEVRPRGFIEIRSIDCLNRSMQSLPILFYLGLLYDHQSLTSVLELLLPQVDSLPKMLQEALYGLKNRELSEIALRLFSMAEEGLFRLPAKFRESNLENQFQNYRLHYVEKGRSPANDVIDVYNEIGPNNFGLNAIKKIEELQNEKLFK